MTVLHKANPSRIYLNDEQTETKFIIQNLRDWPTQEPTTIYARAPGIKLEAKQQSVYTVTLDKPLIVPKRIVMRVLGHSTENVIVDLLPKDLEDENYEDLLAFLEESLKYETDAALEKALKPEIQVWYPDFKAEPDEEPKAGPEADENFE